MKISAKYFREIEYVVVAELPENQQQMLKQFADVDYIKILIDGKIVGPCVQYKQYNEWYTEVYSKHSNVSNQQPAISVKGLAWDKA